MDDVKPAIIHLAGQAGLVVLVCHIGTSPPSCSKKGNKFPKGRTLDNVGFAGLFWDRITLDQVRLSFKNKQISLSKFFNGVRTCAAHQYLQKVRISENQEDIGLNRTCNKPGVLDARFPGVSLS